MRPVTILDTVLRGRPCCAAIAASLAPASRASLMARASLLVMGLRMCALLPLQHLRNRGNRALDVPRNLLDGRSTCAHTHNLLALRSGYCSASGATRNYPLAQRAGCAAICLAPARCSNRFLRDVERRGKALDRLARRASLTQLGNQGRREPMRGHSSQPFSEPC